MDEKEKQANPGSNVVTAEQRGENMAFAAQSLGLGLVANFFEPFIGRWVQKKYADTHRNNGTSKSGNYSQNLVGEFVGDFTGPGAFFLAEAFFPEQLHKVTRASRRFVDPLFTSVAHRAFADERDQPDYEAKIKKWTLFHERNLVRSVIIGASSVAGNLATQKWIMKNPSPLPVIFAGKAASAAVTTSVGLAIRFAFPHQMKRLDSVMSKRYFMPELEDKNLEEQDSHAARVHRDRDSQPSLPAH